MALTLKALIMKQTLKIPTLLVLTLCILSLTTTQAVPDGLEDKKLSKLQPQKKAFSEKKDNLKKLVDTPKNVDVKYYDQDDLYPNGTDTTDSAGNGNITFDAESEKNHKYFSSKFISDADEAKKLWVDMSQLPKLQSYQHEILSNSHRRAASIPLPFKFPFYGHNCVRTTVATGGFLYMGDHLHSWLAATQYIAPLMANFDTRNVSHSKVLYGYNDTMFLVVWERVHLQEQPELEFTFEVQLYSNGNIIFVYKDIPIPVGAINDTGHPVKVGLSDAYFINRHHAYVRRKTIYEYHKVDMKESSISNNTAIVFTAQSTCAVYTSCGDCVLNPKKIDFQCSWCPKLNRCSDGFDRNRQEWVMARCDSDKPGDKPTTLQQCQALGPVNNATADVPKGASTSTDHSPIVPSDHTYNSSDTSSELSPSSLPKASSSRARGHSSLAMTFFLLMATLASIACWVFYAYRNPTTPSGQLLIQWRPKSWRWRSADTRYTAASIHM